MDWQRKVSWRGDRTWVHGQNGLHDVRADLKSREVLLPITRFLRSSTGVELSSIFRSVYAQTCDFATQVEVDIET